MKEEVRLLAGNKARGWMGMDFGEYEIGDMEDWAYDDLLVLGRVKGEIKRESFSTYAG